MEELAGEVVQTHKEKKFQLLNPVSVVLAAYLGWCGHALGKAYSYSDYGFNPIILEKRVFTSEDTFLQFKYTITTPGRHVGYWLYKKLKYQ